MKCPVCGFDLIKENVIVPIEDANEVYVCSQEFDFMIGHIFMIHPFDTEYIKMSNAFTKTQSSYEYAAGSFDYIQRWKIDGDKYIEQETPTTFGELDDGDLFYVNDSTASKDRFVYKKVKIRDANQKYNAWGVNLKHVATFKDYDKVIEI